MWVRIRLKVFESLHVELGIFFKGRSDVYRWPTVRWSVYSDIRLAALTNGTLRMALRYTWQRGFH